MPTFDMGVTWESHDLSHHNFHREGGADDQDFVFEEFVRLRVSGMDEGANETEA